MEMQKKRKTPEKTRPEEKVLPMYSVAVRYRDGNNELMRVKNALDIDDARKVVMDSLVNVHLVLIAELKVPPGRG